MELECDEAGKQSWTVWLKNPNKCPALPPTCLVSSNGPSIMPISTQGHPLPAQEKRHTEYPEAITWVCNLFLGPQFQYLKNRDIKGLW